MVHTRMLFNRGPLVTLIVAFLLAWPAVLAAAPADPLAVVTGYYTAINAGDAEAASAAFADTATVAFVPADVGPPGGLKGKAAIRADFVEQVQIRYRYQLLGTPQVAGDRVTARVRATADIFPPRGIDFLETIEVFTVQNGLIVAETVTLTPESEAKLRNSSRPPTAAPPGLPNTGGGGLARRHGAAEVLTLAGLALLSGLVAVLRRRAA